MKWMERNVFTGSICKWNLKWNIFPGNAHPVPLPPVSPLAWARYSADSGAAFPEQPKSRPWTWEIRFWYGYVKCGTLQAHKGDGSLINTYACYSWEMSLKLSLWYNYFSIFQKQNAVIKNSQNGEDSHSKRI
jgi:hypothetical protein